MLWYIVCVISLQTHKLCVLPVSFDIKTKTSTALAIVFVSYVLILYSLQCMCDFLTYEGKTHTYMCIISYLLHVHVFSDEHANHMNFGSKFYDSLNIALCVYSCNLSITVTWSSRSLQICHDILVAIYCFVNHTLIIHMIFDCDAMLLAFVLLSMFLRNSKEMKNRIICTYICGLTPGQDDMSSSIWIVAVACATLQ